MVLKGENMSKKKVKTQSYTKEYIRNAIDLHLNSDDSLTSVARSLGLPPSTLRQWVQKHEKDSSKYSGEGTLTTEQMELSQLKKELATVRMERDILKKALAIFSTTGK